ncbi:MAG: hypothetical protein HOB79_16000 [Rhodospirillaceae bacterium]|jgi:7-cyano-7-deazaguanine reductase|nr:hypothetical protein [Rhodospirillaceae bacterium]MBT4702572.1 hypothetical protein [Rhodospirillaceae bacterium]MBT5033748.1 hypothetical protein [Rhodospirillaceae bacterium]MBT6221928.1 hypothetical protein [Rhodospirillaceae bacterium]MBT6363884.1 hypothetical protein [Rhodospirillaceae bacterium]
MDTHERRQLLAAIPGPDTEHEILVRMEQAVSFEGDQNSTQIRIMYIPDRLLLPDESLRAYFNVVSTLDYGSLETLAVKLLDDFNNEIVPRWVQIDITTTGAQITATDRQPGWDNPNLLSTIF